MLKPRNKITIGEAGHEQYIEALELTAEQTEEKEIIIIIDAKGYHIAIPKSAWHDFVRRCQALPLS